MSKIRFDSHGFSLAGHLFMANKPHKFAFLLIQGWTGHQNVAAAQALADLGFTSLTYDMRGHGESSGNLADFSRADFISDAITAYDYLKQHLAPATAIGAVGSSFGSYTAILLSEQRPVACLSLRVPANYPDEGFHKPQLAQKEASNDFKQWRQQKMYHHANYAFKALQAFGGPVQLIRAGADEQIPPQVAENYVSAIPNKQQLEYIVMENAPHRLENDRLAAEYQTLLTTWAQQVESRDLG